MNKKSLLLTASLMAGLGAAFFRIFIFNKYFITEENRFAAGAVGWNNAMMAVILCLTAVFFIISMTFKENGPAEFPSSKGTKDSAAASAALLTLSYPLAAILFGSDVFSSANNSMLVLPVMGQIAVFLPLFALVPTVIFLAARFALGSDGSPGFKVLSVLPALWSALYVIKSYFDLSYSFRDANRLVCEIAFLAVSFRFLSESRYYIKYPAPRLFLAASCASMILGTAYALPAVVMTAVGVIPFTLNCCFEIALPAILVYFFIGSLNWARAENAETLPKGEKKEESEEEPIEVNETDKSDAKQSDEK